MENKYQEALGIIKAIGFYPIPPHEIQEAKQVIGELVDKATPKKCRDINEEEVRYSACPCCSKVVKDVWNGANHQPNYCYFCGQRICWSKDDEVEYD